MPDFYYFELQDKDWNVKIARVPPQGGDPWGPLAFIRGTPWECVVRVVSGEAFSHATHGYLTPLMREIGDPPFHQFRRMADGEKTCKLKQAKQCGMAGDECVPCKTTPTCYRPPVQGDWPALAAAVEAWKLGYYVVVVEGEGFILK